MTGSTGPHPLCPASAAMRASPMAHRPAPHRVGRCRARVTAASADRAAARGARPLLAASVLLLAACAPLHPGPTRVAPTTVPAERLQRLVALLEAHWVRWGRVTVQVPAAEVYCADAPDGECAEIETGCGAEMSAALCPLVDEFWRAVPPGIGRHDCDTTDVCTTQWPPFATVARPTTPPWSAAFVGAVMQQAGFGRSEFLPSALHAAYVVAARDGFASAYEVVPTPATAAPGDLICAMRGESTLTPATIGLIAAGPPAPSAMHCDIVVHVDPVANRLEAIGGNVQQAVAKSIVALDTANRVSFDMNPNRRWILVMRARREPG